MDNWYGWKCGSHNCIRNSSPSRCWLCIEMGICLLFYTKLQLNHILFGLCHVHWWGKFYMKWIINIPNNHYWVDENPHHNFSAWNCYSSSSFLSVSGQVSLVTSWLVLFFPRLNGQNYLWISLKYFIELHYRGSTGHKKLNGFYA